MTSTILRRTTGAAAVLLALTALAGCGGDDKTSGSDTPSTETTSSTTDTPSDQTSTSEASQGGDIDPSQFIDAFSSALDNATTAQIGVSISGGQVPTSITGAADFTTTPPSFQMEVNDPTQGKQTLILADGALYFPAPGQEGKFLKTDLKDSPLGGAGANFLDPKASIGVLEKGITSASLNPDEDVDGESLDHYTLQVDSKALLEGSGTSGEQLPPGSLPKSVTYEIYIDGDGLLRKVTTDLGAAGGNVDVTYDHWGDPVDIAVPKPSQIVTTPGG